MATELSEYAADAILNAMFHGVEIAVPTGLTIKIFETMPARDGTGGVETTYTDYVAQVVPCGASSEWAAPSTVGGRRVTSNSTAITFPVSGDTGTHEAAGFGVYDNSGNLIWLDTKAFSIPPAYQPIIAIGDMVFGFSAAAAASYALQDRVLNAFCRNTAFSALTAIEVEHYVTLPDKSDAGGVEASYTGYASTSLDCGLVSDWDAPGDSGGLRMVSNTAAFDSGTQNTSASQDLEGMVLRDNAAVLMAIVAHLATQTIAVGTKITQNANAVRIRF